MTIKETLLATIVAHVVLLLVPKFKAIISFFKELATNDLELYRAIKGDKK